MEDDVGRAEVERGTGRDDCICRISSAFLEIADERSFEGTPWLDEV